MLKFNSTYYGFSFEYPNDWSENRKDLPSRWAIVKNNQTTILYMVNKALRDDLLTLGRSQAFRDIFGDQNVTKIKVKEIVAVEKMVRIDKFENNSWYTYGINFQGKGIDSLVSGTLCKGNEIIFVLVSPTETLELNRETYKSIIGSFSC